MSTTFESMSVNMGYVNIGNFIFEVPNTDTINYL